ncbi:MAG: glutamine--fructose-6-phosphate transaminase (isomerizing) [Candidatus Eiseniibacteriota bacterium]
MCGILGYVGKQDCVDILVEGLKRLEYRGYDSAGISVVSDGALLTTKEAGKICKLEEQLNGNRPRGTIGIAHTRWATHGAPTSRNAHPHHDQSGTIAVVHNGIIENFEFLRRRLEEDGSRFTSESDTEVLAHLIGKYMNGDLEEAVAKALECVEGAYGIAVLSSTDADRIVCARNGSPLLLGIGDGENFVASDAAAILRHTRHVVYLDDREMAVISSRGFKTTNVARKKIQKEICEIDWDLEMVEKQGYDHFMLKEIFEQPQSIRNAIRGRLVPAEGTAHLGGLNMSDAELRAVERCIIMACGTSWHAGLIGEYMLEEHARMPVEVEYGSEFRYRHPIVNPGTISLVISQSGETIDTLEAMREARRMGSRALGICNVVGSTIARESDGGVYIHAGPEIGVASTKAFTSQVAVLAILTLLLGRLKTMSREEGRQLVAELLSIPEKIEKVLKSSGYIRQIAEEYAHHNNFLYLGRGVNFPVALEGALKLKEISYIHAEGYPAAEMKHGPIALIDENMPVVFICLRDSAYDKIISNMEEVRARKGRILAIASKGDEAVRRRADHVIFVPETLEMLSPLLAVVPLQLLAYHIAVLRGCDVDQPRNLAKSVTVE